MYAKQELTQKLRKKILRVYYLPKKNTQSTLKLICRTYQGKIVEHNRPKII